MINKKLIVANWKNRPESLAEAEGILEFTNDYLESLSESRQFSLVFCPPFVFIEEVAKILGASHLEHEASLGAQDIATEDKTAFTGEVSASILSNLGIRYVIVGHSERRWKLGESDEIVNKKLKTVLQNDMIPIVCIGERTRDDNFKKFLEEQVKKTFEGLTANEVEKCIIAYEPVWAISINPGAKPDTPSSALESIHVIKQTLNSKFKIQNSKFLYGGSVNSKNVDAFLKEKEINGVLIGGASVNKEEFVKILKVVSNLS
jgi:triosephosphate isomerase (TIM)